MRKRYRVLLLAVVVAAFGVPVGFALSLDSMPVATQIVHASVAAPVAIPSWVMPDTAKLLGIGTLLFGLAAAVRRTT